jgi:hypothetical protein
LPGHLVNGECRETGSRGISFWGNKSRAKTVIDLACQHPD